MLQGKQKEERYQQGPDPAVTLLLPLCAAYGDGEESTYQEKLNTVLRQINGIFARGSFTLQTKILRYWFCRSRHFREGPGRVQDKGVPPQAASLQPLLPAVRAVSGGCKVTSFQREKQAVDLMKRFCLRVLSGSTAPKHRFGDVYGQNEKHLQNDCV